MRDQHEDGRLPAPKDVPANAIHLFHATDRDYVVLSDGSWRRFDRAEKIPAKRSQIYFPMMPAPDKVQRKFLRENPTAGFSFKVPAGHIATFVTRKAKADDMPPKAEEPKFMSHGMQLS